MLGIHPYRTKMTLPNPNDYSDGVAFFRDMHKLVLRSCADLDTLLADAEARGVFKSFATMLLVG